MLDYKKDNMLDFYKKDRQAVIIAGIIFIVGLSALILIVIFQNISNQ